MLVDCYLTFSTTVQAYLSSNSSFSLNVIAVWLLGLKFIKEPLCQCFFIPDYNNIAQQLHKCSWTRLSLTPTPTSPPSWSLFSWDPMIIYMYFVFCQQNIKPRRNFLSKKCKLYIFISMYQTNPGNKRLLKKWDHFTRNSVLYVQWLIFCRQNVRSLDHRIITIKGGGVAKV